ncbi:MAG: type II toxin-antitoxin system Phd/YefM family antitoxin [Anaerolineales bacterium]|nr:type II toxin-antitoxin system Phd/YefM family antitoxin [Anaerolineales bacterium]
MQTQYSIAEARNQFAALIRKVEESENSVQVTRRGQPVAVILSSEEYQRLLTQQKKPDFWQAYLKFKEEWQDEPMDIEDDIWEGLRDKSPGREENPWL